MPQRDLLLPWRSVLENVIVSQELGGGDLAQARGRAAELLPLFGLQGFEAAYPASLSGGMRQRAALLRTVLTGREVLLLDEPFGALDALTRSELQNWLMEVWGQFRQTVVFITHDVEEALYLGDRVLVLSQRPGRVLRSLPVRLARPRNRAMLTQPEFREQLAELLESLGLAV
jgi:ABC-type nitrate/sulfonate/bicarbonate transport system ATPase subunit